MNEEEIVLEPEDVEQNIDMEPELAIISAVTSVNGKTGDVVLKTSDLENDSDYQTGSEVESAISEAVADKQDKLTAGSNINIDENNVISATDTTYSAGNGLNLDSQNAFSVDTTVVATQQNLSNEVTNRENADNALQAQIDGIAASSDVVDIVGTYAELQSYDTQHLKDNDIIKVLQDETQNNATTYYRWSTATESFTLIGQEGPYYTKAAADSQFVPQTRTINGKALSSNITLNASDVSALSASNIEQTTGSSTSQIMSQKATTDALGIKLNISDYVVDSQLADSTNPVQNKVINNLIGNMPSDFFTGSATTSASGTEVSFNKALKIKEYELEGDTQQQTYTGKNLFDYLSTTYPFDKNGIHAVKNDDDSITFSGVLATNYTGLISNIDITSILDDGQVYTISQTTANSNLFIDVFAYLAGTTTTANIARCSWDRTKSFTVDKTTYDTYFVRVMTGNTSGWGTSSRTITQQFQLEKGTATTFEKYVGGTASPNPSFPQNIDVVTGEQTVKLTGKNIFKGGSADYTGTNAWYGYGVSTYTNVDGVYTIPESFGAIGFEYDNLVVGQQYTLSFDVVSTLSGVCFAGINRYAGASPTGDSVRIESSTTSQRVSLTFTATATNRIAFNSGSTAGFSVSYSNIQLEKSATATAYESYQNQSYTIDLGSTELAKIGDYQDYIYKNGDDWYVHKETNKLVLDGTVGGYNTNYKWFYANPSGYSEPATISGQMYYSDAFTFYNRTTFAGDNTIIGCSVDVGTGPALLIRNTAYSDANGYKTWLGTNNVTMYYVVATPTDTKITDSTLIGELEALLDATCYDGTTILTVSASGSNLPAGLEMGVYNNNLAGIVASIKNN